MCNTIVVIFRERAVARRIEFVDTQVLVDFLYIIIRVRHRDDRTGFHEYRQFPKRRGEVVDNAAACILFTCEIVEPFAFRQIDSVADVVTFLVCLCFLVDRGNEEIRAIHKLVLRSLTVCIRIRIFEEHGADHRLAV